MRDGFQPHRLHGDIGDGWCVVYGKTGIRNSTRQNGGDVDDFGSPLDMDVSYDCGLNLSIVFEPTC